MRNSAFAEGFVDGFTCWANLFAPRRIDPDKYKTSIEESWKRVGDYLYKAMGQVRNEEAVTSSRKAAELTKIRIKSLRKQIGELQAATETEQKLLAMLEQTERGECVLRLKKLQDGKQVLVSEPIRANGNGGQRRTA